MKHYPDRFHMTPEQSLFLAKKKWDENVYCGMRMESRNITFPQTKTILQGVNVPNVQLDDIQAVFRMTPYYFHTSLKDKEKLAAYDTLETPISFVIAEYAK